ncbi:MAG: polysaccharide deacetylase family protein [bacterium]
MSFRTWCRNQLIRAIGSFRDPTESSNSPTYRILSYHRIRAQQQVAFQHQLDRLQKKYNIVTPEEFRADEGSSKTLNLLLTFDDGYLDWESQVLAELNKRNLKAVFFICPDLVGLNKEDAAEYFETHLNLQPTLALTDSGVQRILQEGHTLGDHFVRHADLRDTRDKQKILSIIDESLSTFRKRFELTPDWLAYPFGDHFEGAETLRECVSNHYSYGLTLIPGTNSKDTDPYFLRRDAFSPDYSPSLEDAWLSGGFDPIFQLTHSTYTLP